MVWRRPGGRALVSTVDVFTPIVDDPGTWGRIAAANAASDVYAMGGTPLFALAVAAWPRDRLPLELLTEVLRGGEATAQEGRWLVAGGHTIDGPEPLYGQAVIGEVDPDAVLTNAGARPGEVLLLTKPIGTGLVATAIKRRDRAAALPGGEIHDVVEAAVAAMTRLNDTAAEVARRYRASAATDVTGYGLLGHLRELTRASGVGACLEVAAVPYLPGVEALVVNGDVPGGTRRNLEDVRDDLDLGPGIDEDALVVLADAQTSGGLLMTLDAAVAEEALDDLRASGHEAARIGEVREDPHGRIALQ